MPALVGDEIRVAARITGGEPREGEIVEVREQGGVVHYLVRWDDGHETVFFPGSDAHVVHLGRLPGGTHSSTRRGRIDATKHAAQ